MVRKAKPALTREAWLDELGRRLVWTFSAGQVKDILSDYQEQFEAGHDHCKTEAEVIQGLGTPAEAAALLLEEESAARTNGLRHSIIWCAALAVCCAFGWMCFASWSPGLFWIGSLLFVPLAASALFMLLRGPARVALERQAEKTASPVSVYCISFAVTLLFEAVEQILLVLSTSQTIRLPGFIAGMPIGEANTWFVLATEVIVGLIALRLLYKCVTVSVRYFPGIVHSLGAACSIFFTYAFFVGVSLEPSLPLSIELLLRLLPYCSGLIAALVFQRWIDGRKPLPRLFQGGAATWEDWRHRLGVSLLGWFSVEQALEILEDYQEQYELGREQGKNEENLLAEMGHPGTVIRDLLAEDRKARLNRRKTRGWAVLAAVSGWLLLGLLRSFEFGYGGFGGLYHRNAIQVSLFSIALGTISLFFLLHVRERAAVERRFPAPLKPAAWVYLPPPLASALVEGLALWCVYGVMDHQLPGILGRPLTWFLVVSIELSSLLLTALLIWTLARCVSGSIRHLPAAPCIAGSFAQVLCVGMTLSRMDIESSMSGTVEAVLTALVPCLAGVLLAAASWLVLRAAGRRED